MLICPYCYNAGRITESPWALPWIGLVDSRAQGGEIAVDCTVCGFKAKRAHYCSWPCANGHIVTRSEAHEEALSNFRHGIKPRQLEKP